MRMLADGDPDAHLRRRALALALALGALTVVHFTIGVASHPQHVVHVGLELGYLLVVIAAAVWFGVRGGLAAGAGAAAALGAHALSSWSGQPMENANQLAMMAVFVAVGAVAGGLVDAQFRAKREKIIEALAALESALGFRDDATRLHGERVAALAVDMGRALGFDAASLERLRLAALVHDLGKIGIADDVLMKPEELTPAERHHIEQHPRIAAEILRHLHGAQAVSRIVASHHERIDGSGYPAGLRAHEIPREALVLSVADVYCALAEPRPYKPGLSTPEILDIMAPLAGKKLDAAAFGALQSILHQQGEPGARNVEG